MSWRSNDTTRFVQLPTDGDLSTKTATSNSYLSIIKLVRVRILPVKSLRVYAKCKHVCYSNIQVRVEI